MRNFFFVSVLAMGLAILGTARRAVGMFIAPRVNSIPVDRLIQNTEVYLHKHPGDATSYYTLGRLHYMAAAMKSGIVYAYIPAKASTSSLPQVRTWPRTYVPADRDQLLSELRSVEAQRRLKDKGITYPLHYTPEKYKQYHEAYEAVEQKLKKENWRPEGFDLTQQQVDQHAKAGIVALRQTLKLKPDNPLAELTLASLLDQYTPRADHLRLDIVSLKPVKASDDVVTHQWREAALKHYAKAFMLSRVEDSKVKHRPTPYGLPWLLSYEAAKQYLALAKTMDKPTGRGSVGAQMKVQITKLKALPPPKYVTHVIFSFTPNKALADLLDSKAHVRFDLDGTGRAQHWPWVQPTTGILVWDPKQTGRITSGRQLFGSVTWWIFWRNGYDALAALDDNHDGQLAGHELRGIAAWFDRNQNGISDPGEVTPVKKLGITAIATRSAGHAGRSPMNRAGLQLADGRSLPTWDWIATPLNH